MEPPPAVHMFRRQRWAQYGAVERMDSKTIVISINSAWNIYNFRKDLILALQREGWAIVALAPEDDYSRRLADLDRKSTRLNSSHQPQSRMPSSA